MLGLGVRVRARVRVRVRFGEIVKVRVRVMGWVCQYLHIDLTRTPTLALTRAKGMAVEVVAKVVFFTLTWWSRVRVRLV